ncbi:MAG TPA: glycerophosphodiester phosphodiesterase family protein [Vicinamibacterales bacterium]|nr:glycerophosphodiester phosphodiesterase family protein [Vicinamibacterales bacterium]HPW21132.1 glycerophosphodiester phosphodiesterase family protein [Vicinamibacterales bacterium]
MMTRYLALAACAVTPCLACAVLHAQAPAAKKILVAHRGASAYAPEHSAEAYTLAIAQGADFVEQDLAVTKDGVLVSIHDVSLERTTNVEEVFPDRFVEEATAKGPLKRWYVNDFTLAEIKRLDAGSSFDKKFTGTRMLTFQEAIDLVRGKAGLYPELKDPEFYRRRGVDQVRLFADVVKKNGLEADPKTPLIVQSFDEATLRAVGNLLPSVPRVFLVSPQAADRLDSPAKLREIAAWATGIGPSKLIFEKLPDLVAWAHAAKLTVTPWTFRPPAPPQFPTIREEMSYFLFTLGVDALFTDNPDMFPRTK